MIMSVRFKEVFRDFTMRRNAFFDEAEWSNAGNVVWYEQGHCAYNRIRKSANSSVLMFMADALMGNGSCSDGAGAGYKNYKKQSLKLGRPLNKLWRSSQINEVQHCFWFTVVRNPYTRLLSAFLQKGAERNQTNKLFSDIPGFGTLNPEGFAEFISYLENGGLYVNKHWWPQHKLLFFPPERFDYIAKTETLEVDMGHILREIGLKNIPTSSFSKPHRTERASGWKVTNANDQLLKFYNPELFERVYKLYRDDFVFFGYQS
jgi:hypothetical protein